MIKNGYGYSFDIKASLQQLIDKAGNPKDKVVQQYLALIRESARDAGSSNKATQFMLDGFSSVLGDLAVNIDNDVDASTESQQQTDIDNVVAAFHSGVPDFSATFTSAVEHERGQYLYPTSMSLTFSQHTTVERQAEKLLIQQSTSYEFSTTKIKGLPGTTKGDTQSGNFIYESIYKAGDTKRILDMTGETVDNIWEEKSATEKIIDLAVINFHRQEPITSTKNDHHILQLFDEASAKAELKDKDSNQDLTRIIKMLNESKNTIFLKL